MDYNNVSESTPFLSSKSNESRVLPRYSPEFIYRNFYLMSAAFSLNHACAVTCLAYASAELGNDLGGATSGILYVFYAATAFLFAKPIVTFIGPLRGLLFGVIGYTIFTASFLFGIQFKDIAPTATWIVTCLAAALAGVAGGLVWTSQGKIFSRHARAYTEATRSKIEIVNSDFAGVFAAMFLGMELLVKISTTLLFLISSSPYALSLIFAGYVLLALSSCFAIVSLDGLGDIGTFDFSYPRISKDAAAAARLVYMDSRLTLITPFQVAFGFGASFVPYYVFGTVIANSPDLGTTWVGLLSALVVLSGACAAIPAARISNYLGKPLVISAGVLCLAAVGLFFYFKTDLEMGTWENIVPMLVLFGISRGIWENTNKAVVADFYANSNQQDNVITAFASVAFFQGYGSAMGYFIFPHIPRIDMVSCVFVTALISLVCYHMAFWKHEWMKKEKTMDEKKGEVRRAFYAHTGKPLPTDGGVNQRNQVHWGDDSEIDEKEKEGQVVNQPWLGSGSVDSQQI